MEIILSRLKKIAFIETIIVFLLCLVVLTGWHFNINMLKRVVPDSVSMNPLSALTFMMTILSLFFLVSSDEKMIKAGKILALAVMTTGFIRILELVSVLKTGITNLLFHSKVLEDRFSGLPNNMAPNTALCFLLIGASLACYHARMGIKKLLADCLSLLTALIAFTCIIGYLYRGIALYRVRGFIPMAVPTAIAFFLLSTAILLYRSEFGIFRFLLTPYDGSRMARFLVPCALSLPVITGLINEYGETKGWFSSSSSVALFTIVHVLLFVLLVWYSTKSINKSAAELAEQRQRTKELDEQLAIKQAKEFERKLLENRLRQQNELIQATIEAEEKERKQIGMELHDHINQILASTKLYLELAKMDDSLRDDILEKCTLQLNFAISEIRNLSRSLVLHETETGDILGNLFESINHIESSAGIRIESNICDASMNLLCQKEKVAIYRIIQEQLSNIVKHAAATNVNIRFCSEGDYIKLVISDNGKGFDIKKQHRGIGLSNINSRVTSLNGELKIISSAGNGCELSIVLPR